MLIERQPPPETVKLNVMPIIGVVFGLLVLLVVGLQYVNIDRPAPGGTKSDGVAQPNEPGVTVTADGRVTLSHAPYTLAPLGRSDALPRAVRKTARPAVAQARWPLTEIALPSAAPAPHDLRAFRAAESPVELAESLRPLSPPAPAVELPPADPLPAPRTSAAAAPSTSMP